MFFKPLYTKRLLIFTIFANINSIIFLIIQEIYAAELGVAVSTFGWSLSGGLDMDNNYYPDILVGAYEANKVFMFK